jgi:glycosyltransferase involved in cell wall biosynthesis
MQDNPLISIVLPCRNEEKTIGICITKIKDAMATMGEDSYEIIVSDSSKDLSPFIAKDLGAKVVKHKKGYGDAYLEGFKHASGKYMIIGDSDNTYDFSDIPKFIFYLRQGYDFVLGNRLNRSMKKAAMPWLHRYIGNPMLSALLRLFFNANIKDAHCGIRAFTKEALDKMELRTKGMEFASEMIVKAIKNNLKIKQIPVIYYPRLGKSKLSSFSDGWRHLRFMLMYAPNYLFLIPGISLFFIGTIIFYFFLSGPVTLLGIKFQNHPAIIGGFFILLGYQIVTFGICSKAYLKSAGLIKSDRLLDMTARFVSFESGVIIGLAALVISSLAGAAIFLYWFSMGFPSFQSNIPLLILVIAILGVQTIFSTFFLSILLIERK